MIQQRYQDFSKVIRIKRIKLNLLRTRNNLEKKYTENFTNTLSGKELHKQII